MRRVVYSLFLSLFLIAMLIQKIISLANIRHEVNHDDSYLYFSHNPRSAAKLRCTQCDAIKTMQEIFTIYT